MAENICFVWFLKHHIVDEKEGCHDGRQIHGQTECVDWTRILAEFAKLIMFQLNA